MKTSRLQRNRPRYLTFVCEQLETRNLFSTAMLVASPPPPTAAPTPHVVSSLADDGFWDFVDDSLDDASSDAQDAAQDSSQDSDQPQPDDSSQYDDSSSDDSSDDYTSDDSGGDVVYPPGAPYGLRAQATSPTSVQLTWSGDLWNTDGFEVARLAPGQSWTYIADVGGTGYTDTGLQPDTGYSYTVIAYNSAGYSDFSLPASVVTPDFPRSPIGSIDIANANTVSGWTLDPNTTGASITVSTYVDGGLVSTSAADAGRPDLVRAFGSANHGFTVSLPTLSAGIHRLDVYASDSSDGSQTLLGSRTIETNHSPMGSLDVFDGSTLAGWAFDADAGANAVQIRYVLDNNAPMAATAGSLRPDLASYLGSADHGFSLTLPQLTAGNHFVSVFAVDPNSATLVMLGQRSVNVAAPAGDSLPMGSLDVANSTLVAGWGRDPASPSDSVSFRIDIDGVEGTPHLADASRGDLASYYGNGTFGFVQPLSLSPGQHRIDIFLLSTPTSTPVFLASRMVGQAAPIGSLDIVNGSMAAGWAYSPAYAGNAATIRIDVDGLLGPLTNASLARADLAGYLGDANHSFNIAMPRLAPGQHNVRLVVIDPVSLLQTVIAQGMFVTV